MRGADVDAGARPRSEAFRTQDLTLLATGTKSRAFTAVVTRRTGSRLVDDEPLARQGIALRLRSHPYLTVIGECSSGNDARQFICRHKPDLVFLDIQMPSMNGIEMLRSLNPDQQPFLTFLTAYDEYVKQAFEVHAIDYLWKPIGDTRFVPALQHARRLLGGSQTKTYQERLSSLLSNDANVASLLRDFAVRSGKQVTFVPVQDVDWIETQGDYAEPHVGKRTHLVREPLNVLEGRLSNGEFLRIHRSAIVGLNRIARLSSLPNRD
jgi:two-component system LytT family response regulator